MIFSSSGFRKSDVTFMARVLGADGSPLLPASVSSATYGLFDLDGATPEVAIISGPLTISDVFYNRLILDLRWQVDFIGWNFKLSLPGKYFREADHQYQVEVKSLATTGEVFWLVFQYLTQRTFIADTQGNVTRSLAVNWESR